MSETVVAKASPTVTATGPASGTIGTAITAANISSVLAGGTTAPAVSGTITFTVFGPQATAPTTCTTGGTRWGPGPRSPATPPITRRPASHRGCR